jgi:PAS domain S-box-containing protein
VQATDDLQRIKTGITLVSLVSFALVSGGYTVVAFLSDLTLKYVYLLNVFLLVTGLGLQRVNSVYGAVAITVVLLAYATIELITFGMNGSHLQYLVLGALYSGLLVNVRYGVAWLLAGALMVWIVVAALASGSLPPPISVNSGEVRFIDEFTGIIAFAGITLLISTLLNTRLERALQNSNELVNQLSSEIEQRKQAVASSLTSEQNYQLLADNISDVVFTLSPELEAIYISPSIMNQRGFTPDEALARRAVDDISKETLPQMLEVVRQAAEDMARGEEKPFYVSEYEILHRDGHYVWIESRFSIIRTSEGELEYVIGVNRDVSRRKQAEAKKSQLETNVRMLQRNESLAVMAGGVAHDFNNILVAIMGYADLSLSDNLPQSTRENLEGILRSTRRAAKLTDQLLAFGRRQQFDTTTFDLRDLIFELQQMLSRLVPADIQIVHDFFNEIVKVQADRSQLEQIIVNLVINARDAMPNGGKLTVKIENATEADQYLKMMSAEIDLHQLGYVKMTVRDTGEGIPSDVKEHMFEPFFSTKPEGKGTGLGLAVVAGIIDQHDGFLDPKSDDSGTTFNIYLPLSDAELTQELVSNERVTDDSNQTETTILCVDDNEDVRKIAALMLGRARYRVIQASDGRQAIQSFEAHREDIDLILLDIVMPNIGGQEVFEQLVKLGCDAPVIFTSGYHEDAARNDFVHQAGSRLLKKPYTRAQLLELVEGTLNKAESHDNKNIVSA